MRRSLVIGAMALLAGAATIAGFSVVAQSADHQDAPGTKANPTADINDVFTWMDGNNVFLAMTTYPEAPTGALFDNTVQYVFHTASAIAFTGPVPTTGGVDVVVTFTGTAAPQTAQVWVGTSDYVTGNANVSAGLVSADQKVKVYAGLVADPFFFNLDGFHKAVATVSGAAGSLTFNDAGCPALNTATSDLLIGELATNPDGGLVAVNHFATFNGLGIVVEVDKSLLALNGQAFVSVWGATYSTAASQDAGGE
jgi:hypothetical protein